MRRSHKWQLVIRLRKKNKKYKQKRKVTSELTAQFESLKDVKKKERYKLFKDL